ncbi:MAG: hypothetical protein ABW101_16785, partial [Candidatus Thiodiazotropha sp.]
MPIDITQNCPNLLGMSKSGPAFPRGAWQGDSRCKLASLDDQSRIHRLNRAVVVMVHGMRKLLDL